MTKYNFLEKKHYDWNTQKFQEIILLSTKSLYGVYNYGHLEKLTSGDFFEGLSILSRYNSAT